MKIQSINNIIRNNAQNKVRTNNYFHTSPMKNDSVAFSNKISFKGEKSDFLYSIEGRALEMDSASAIKNAIRARDDDAEKIMIESQEILDRVGDIQTRADITISQVKAILKEAKQRNDRYSDVINPITGESEIEFYTEKDAFVMEEFGFEEESVRKTIITSDKITVQDTGDKRRGLEVFTFDRKTGKLLHYYEGLNLYAVRNGFSAKHHYEFQNGELKGYNKNYSRSFGKSEDASEHTEFNRERLAKFSIDWHKTDGQEEKAMYEYLYGRSGLIKFSRDIKKEGKKQVSASTQIVYGKDGLVNLYIKDLRHEPNYATIAKTIFQYKDQELTKAWQNRIYGNDGTVTASKLYTFKEGTAKTCMTEFEQVPEGKPSWDRKIHLSSIKY